MDLSSRYITDRKLPDKAIDVIDEAAAAVALKGSNGKGNRTITAEMVQTVVAKMARIPISKVTVTERESLRDLDVRLKAKVFGQDRAIEALASAIKLSRSGLGDEDRPIGSFLFTGPTGVGKTEVAESAHTAKNSRPQESHSSNGLSSQSLLFTSIKNTCRGDDS